MVPCDSFLILIFHPGIPASDRSVMSPGCLSRLTQFVVQSLGSGCGWLECHPPAEHLGDCSHSCQDNCPFEHAGL